MRRTAIFILSYLLYSISAFSSTQASPVTVGMDQLFTTKYQSTLKGKHIGLITNHTGITKNMQLSLDLVIEQAKKYNYTVVAIFGPEHGITGTAYASEHVAHESYKGIPVYSLHGSTRRPTKEMLKGIDLLLYDIQDIGCRHYTYISTLFYVMEEAAKLKIPVIVTDRPNPINGITIDGPMLDESQRSFVGYVDVPLCHGMTAGELAQLFNKEYNIKCDLTIIPMKGWKREMSFKDTKLVWVPTSPQIPEPDTPIYYLSTAVLGEGLNSVSTGVGYTLPFKIVGAPWINAPIFAKHLNAQNYPGIYFEPFHFRPFFGRHKGKDCHGVRLVVTNPKTYLPVSSQFLIMGVLKTLYPNQFAKGISNRSKQQTRMFNILIGSEEVFKIIQKDRYIAWKLRSFDKERRKTFKKNRKQYLIPEYS